MDRRLIGYKLREFWTLAGFGKVITFTSFPGDGKCDS
jgi:hypothetical protein